MTTENSTSKSPTLKTIVNLFAADANSISSLINETDVLTGWADETSTNNRTGKTTPAPTTKPRKWKTINGLKWFYNPANNTISCSNLVNGYIYQKETTDQSSSRATSPAFQQFKDNQSITVTINVASDFGDSLKGNDASTPPSTGGSGKTTQGGNSRTTGSKKYN